MPIFIFVQSFLPSLINWLVSLNAGKASDPREIEAMRKIEKLKADQKELSMMDDFAKWAKIDRQIIALQEEVKKFSGSRAQHVQDAKNSLKKTLYSAFVSLETSLSPINN